MICWDGDSGSYFIFRSDVYKIQLRKDAAQELLAMGIPTGLQFSITALGSMVMQSANNGLGSVYVSAFTAAMKIKQFMMLSLIHILRCLLR